MRPSKNHSLSNFFAPPFFACDVVIVSTGRTTYNVQVFISDFIHWKKRRSLVTKEILYRGLKFISHQQEQIWMCGQAAESNKVIRIFIL